MLVKVNVPYNSREGQGFLNAGTSGLNKGCFVRLGGVFATAAGPSGSEGTPGYAPAGAIRFDLAGVYNSGYGFIGVIDKLETQLESSDLTLDTIASGEGCIVYTQGMFETDQYALIDTNTAVGTKLYINSSAKLTTTATANTKPVAVFWGYKSTFDSNYSATGLIRFELLPNTWLDA